MMCDKTEQERLQALIVEAIGTVCKDSLAYKKALNIVGLLGITLDEENVCLVQVNERYERQEIEEISIVTNEPEIEVADSVVLPVEDCVETDNGSKEIELVLSSKPDSNPDDDIHIVTDLQPSYKYGVLDVLLSNDRKRDMFDDTTVNLFNTEELERIISGKPPCEPKDPDLDVTSDSSSAEADIKQEELVNALTNSVPCGPVSDDITMETITTEPPSEDRECDLGQMTGCSSWDDQFVESMASTMSEIQPEDLSTSPQAKKKRSKTCVFCHQKFKSRQSLKKHSCTAVQVDELVGDLSEPLNLISKPLDLISKPLNLISKPLDLTMTRIDEDCDSDLAMVEQESFACVCRKSMSDYEAYIEHISACSKAKLTPYKSCDICGKHFFSSSGFLKHKRLHLGSYKFHCSICHKGFFDKTHLGAHMDSSHRKVRRYVCEVCNKSFCWKHHLKRHLVMHQTGQNSEDVA